MDRQKIIRFQKVAGFFFPGRNKSAVRLPMTKYFYINLKINKPSSFLKGFTC